VKTNHWTLRRPSAPTEPVPSPDWVNELADAAALVSWHVDRAEADRARQSADRLARDLRSSD
jgi:hypothetical protein